MTISLAFNRRLRNSLLVMALAWLLAGCIQPDAPLPADIAGAAPTSLPTAGVIGAAPPAATRKPGQVFPATAAPLPTPVFAPTSAPEPPTRIWRNQPVGPEQVAVMFYLDPAGNRCVRYIFRAQVVAKCAAPNQTLVGVSGSVKAADNKTYTIITGRVLDDRITAVSIEMANGANSPAEVNDRGFILVVNGAIKPTRAIPVDQFGNLVGDNFNF